MVFMVLAGFRQSILGSIDTLSSIPSQPHTWKSSYPYQELALGTRLPYLRVLVTLICDVLLVLVTLRRSPPADLDPLSGNMKYKSIKLGSGDTEETVAAFGVANKNGWELL
ncbi:hypothetical protein E2C01_074120 [Portunus trituberculatus]|uniref:Uncharacterized protein n=1 Tax=Portunus trituberculatus TaxID=210409 RepID=A0A5B7IBJ1_PORTR|nr:hypothetical protein [Portunus trituberculatus]